MKLFRYLKLVLLLFVATGSFAQVTQVGTYTTAYGANVASVVVAKPTGTQIGDVLIMSVIKYVAGNSDDSWVNDNTGTGWTVLVTGALGGNANYRATLLYKVVTVAQEPASYTVIATAGGSPSATYMEAALVSYRGVNISSPINVSSALVSPGTTTGSTITIPSITTTQANTFGLIFSMNYRSGTNNAPRTHSSFTTLNVGSFTELYDYQGGIKTSLGAAYSQLPAAGSTGNATVTLSGTGTYRGAVMLALSPATITTGSLSASAFCVGANVSVPFTTTGYFNAGNVFTAQLSDINGSFSAPTSIGTFAGTASGSINAVIPVAATAGTGYRIRVVSSSPVLTGSDNGANISVVAIPVAPVTTGANICIGSASGVTLSASGAVAGQQYKWYSAATDGTLLKTSTDNNDNTYTTTALSATTNFWVSVVNSTGCESDRALVVANFPEVSAESQTTAATDSWIGHVYAGTNLNTYYGTITEAETFDQSFGGAANCFPFTSGVNTYTINTEQFSVRYRMNSTKRGLYVVDMGSDDGNRLYVDGNLVFNNWADQAYTARPSVLMALGGSSSLIYDFYENGGENRAVFQNFVKVFDNTLSANTAQTINMGSSGSAISGDTYGTLPGGISLSGTGYQWTYSTTPGGARTNISGATGATFIPNTSVAPFNAAGTYYVYRNAVLSSANNVSPNPYVATLESNACTIVIKTVPLISASTTTINSFTYKQNAGPSAILSFTVSANYLTDNVLVYSSTLFEVSEYDGVLFSAQPFITLQPSGGALSKTVYVRMKAGLTMGSYGPQNLVMTSVGAATVNVACSGTVTAQPAVTPTAISGTFTYVFKSNTLSERSFTITGTNLSDGIVITPPANYEISTTSGANYVSTPISIAQTGGTIAAPNPRTIYVRLKTGLGIGTYNENIVITSTSADSKTVALSGSVTPVATLTTNTAWLAGFIYTFGDTNPASQTFYVNGSNLTQDVTLTVPTAPQQFQLSTNGTTWSGSVTLTQNAGSISNALVYARLNTGLSLGSYGPVNVSINTAGAVVKTVALSGQVVNSPTILVSKSSLTGFGYLFNNGPSASQVVTVSGASLTNNITVNCPANYQISTDNVNFGSAAITLTRSGGQVNPTQIYYRLQSGLSAATYNTSISVASSGASSRTLALYGKVFATPLITSTGEGEYCVGDNVQLTSSGQDVESRFWSGPNSFYSNLNDPLLTGVNQAKSGIYTVTGNIVVGGNLIVNGDFEMDNAGFGSSYGYVTPTTGALYPEGLYTVTSLASNVHGNFNSTPDKNVIGTKQMVINGNTTAGAVVWSQSVSVSTQANYEFTYWLQTVVNGTDPAPSKLQLYVNGEMAGPIYTANPASGNWTQYVYNTSSGSNTILNLELINQTTAANGNDFALDSITFRQILSSSSSENVLVSPYVTPSVNVTYSPTTVYQNSPVVFTANPVNGGTTPAYKWFVGGVEQVGETAATYSYTPLSTASLYVRCEMTSSIKCASPKPATDTKTITVQLPPANYWMGNIDTDWGKSGNWTANYIPATGDNVVYATVANYGTAAVRDLQLDQNRTIGSLINATIRRLIIPANKTLICNNVVTVTPPVTNPVTNAEDLIYIQASATLPNGSIVYRNPQNLPAFGTVEMYSPASWNLSMPVNQKYNWQFFGIPVTSVSALPTFYGAYVRELLENDKDTATHWRALSNESVLQPFVGYELCQQSPRFYTFKGQLINSNYNSGQFIKTSNALYPGQHLFANPYTAAIDIKQIEFGTGVEASAYLYATGSFIQWRNNKLNNTGAIPGQYFSVPKAQAGDFGIPRQVPSMGTFMVRVPKVSQSTELSYVALNYNTVSMGNSDRQRVKTNTAVDEQATTVIEVEGENGADRMWIMSHDSYKRGFDNGYDGLKLLGTVLNPQIYAIEKDGKYQINSVDDLNNTSLAFQAGTDTDYKLVFRHNENTLSKYNKIYLHDLVENRVVDISQSGSEYVFKANAGSATGVRFKLIARKVSDELNQENLTKPYFYGSELFVQNFTNKSGKVYVYDISGKITGVKAINSNENICFPVNRNTIYLVKVTIENKTESHKLIYN